MLCLRSRELDGRVDEPRVPAGYALRHVGGGADLERRMAVHRAAFAPSRMSAAKHRGVMGSQTYRPDLDLIVLAPDGSFAAFCIVWLDEANGLGVFEPVGTHPEHRRRGLGMEGLREGMRRVRALGARTAFVTSLGSAEPANALYDAVGLPVMDQNRAWQWTL